MAPKNGLYGPHMTEFDGGMMLKTLEEFGMENNTIVIKTASYSSIA
jgi:hypothetical protein